ncbi:MurR/RpiR family transcriptional regulator [Rhizobium sp. BT03]|uniref:MurR/RpiR family transcriptional regulator n=1 Tax=Rhizobium sp. BT03 TaxID=3045156 RepID=UPI0024B3CD4B|nr:hypothetical protein [Rhizobium sp. BT03]WHO76028.1 hypothetical protein QMO80_005134 [Rhizobium sp. BT03]
MPNIPHTSDQHPQTLREIEQFIAKKRIRLPRQLEQVARQMLAQPELIAFESAAAVAKKCNVSQTTVMRLGSHLGIGSYRSLKKLCASHIRERFEFTP